MLSEFSNGDYFMQSKSTSTCRKLFLSSETSDYKIVQLIKFESAGKCYSVIKSTTVNLELKFFGPIFITLSLMLTLRQIV